MASNFYVKLAATAAKLIADKGAPLVAARLLGTDETGYTVAPVAFYGLVLPAGDRTVHVMEQRVEAEARDLLASIPSGSDLRAGDVLISEAKYWTVLWTAPLAPDTKTTLITKGGVALTALSQLQETALVDALAAMNGGAP